VFVQRGIFHQLDVTDRTLVPKFSLMRTNLGILQEVSYFIMKIKFLLP